MQIWQFVLDIISSYPFYALEFYKQMCFCNFAWLYKQTKNLRTESWVNDFSLEFSFKCGGKLWYGASYCLAGALFFNNSTNTSVEIIFFGKKIKLVFW